MSVQRIAVDVGHGFVKALTAEGTPVLFPSLLAPAPVTEHWNFGPIAADRPVYVTWHGEEPRAYLVGDAAQLTASSVFSTQKNDNRTRDLTALAMAKCLPTPGNQIVHLAVGVPLGWYQRDREPLQKALTGTVTVNHRTMECQKVVVLPQGVAAVVAALPPNTAPGWYGLVDIGYRTTDFLVVRVDADHRPRLESTLAGTADLGVHHALNRVASLIAQQYHVDYSPHELSRATTITASGQEYSIDQELIQAYHWLRDAIQAKIETQWDTVVLRLRALYLVGGGATIVQTLTIGQISGTILPDPQWANAHGYLAALASTTPTGN